MLIQHRKTTGLKHRSAGNAILGALLQSHVTFNSPHIFLTKFDINIKPNFPQRQQEWPSNKAYMLGIEIQASTLDCGNVGSCVTIEVSDPCFSTIISSPKTQNNYVF